jgi:hypothetical protein
MAIHAEVSLKLRCCSNPDCLSLFAICSGCDRGQRYCSPSCRSQARRRQHRAANRRYQCSTEGRLDHRDRQKRYRCRPCAKSVTDQGSQKSDFPSPSKQDEVIQQLSKAAMQSRLHLRGVFVLRCAVCGRPGHLLDPFPRISTRR